MPSGFPDDPPPPTPGGGGVFFGGGGGGVIPTGGLRAGFLGSRRPIQQPFDPRRRRAQMLAPTNALAGGGTGEQYTPQPSYSITPAGSAPYVGGGGGSVSDQYSNAANTVNSAAGKFQFTPDQNDPELAAMHSRLQQSQMARFLRSRDEYARAGLLGSSQQISGGQALQDQFGDEQYGADQDIFNRQRSDQFDLYNNDLSFRRSAELARLGLLSQEDIMRLQDQMQRSRENENLLGMLYGGIGEAGAGIGYDYLHSILNKKGH